MAPYVEMRMGTFLTLIGTLFSGLVFGRAVFPSATAYFQPFLSASWIMGCYFSLFFYREFKVGIWRVFDWKYFYFENNIFVPILFVSSWWAHLFTSRFDKAYLIENLFPVGIWLLGVVLGFWFKNKRPIPMGFLYEFEWSRWRSLIKRNVELKKLVAVAGVILEFNPDNLKVQYDVCKKIVNEFKNEAWNDKNIILFFNKQLSSLLEHLIKENRLESGLELLLTLPIKTSFHKVFTQISSLNLLTFAKVAEKKQLNVLAITLLSAFIEKNPKLKKNQEILKTIDLLLEVEMDLQSNIDLLQFLEVIVVVPELKHLFKQHFQFSRTAVVTAVSKKSS